MKHAYADIPAGQIYYENEGTGEPIVCLHQTAWSSWEYEKLIPLLSKSYRIIAMDSLGFGFSDPTPPEWQFVEDWANSVLQFLDAIGVEKAHLIGHHTGAKLAVEVAASHPERVNKIVLSGCGIYAENPEPKYDPESPWSKQTQTTTLSERIALRRKLRDVEPEIPVSGSHILEMWHTQIHENPDSDAEGIQRVFLDNIRAFDKRCSFNSRMPNVIEYDLEGRARLVKCPALLMVGTKDCFYPPVCQPPEAVAKIIPSCKLAYIEGAGIMGLHTHPEEFAKPILEFLEGQGA